MLLRYLLLASTTLLLVLMGTRSPIDPAPPPEQRDDAGITHNDLDSLSGPSYQLLQAAYGPSIAPVHSPNISALQISESTLWLARAIFSETKRPHEQELVAWVVRNRVETQYRGKSTYKEVVLDPYQFSAFNPGSASRPFLVDLAPSLPLPSWQRSLWIAHYVRNASPALRPFSIETRHFYSERSLTPPAPAWIDHNHFVSINALYEIDERRFRFYKAIS